MLIGQIFGVLSSFVILYFGAELALNRSEKMGKALGLSPLTIGVLIIGFGTSLPELFVSQIAGWNGNSQMAMGNLLGSNIANSFLILGMSSLFASIEIRGKKILGQLLFQLALCLGLLFFLKPPELGKILALGLCLFFVFYLFYSLKTGGVSESEGGRERENFHLLDPMVFLIGIGLLFFGGELLVSQGSALGKSLGVSDYILSVVFISLGTSFPELITALLACYRKKDTNLIIGNILGSNIFNLALILGSLGLYPIKIEKPLTIELLSLLGVSLLFFVFYRLGKLPKVWGGIILLGAYGLILFLLGS